MAHYLIQASYNNEAVSELVKNPQDRLAAVRPVVERMGGRIEALYFAFGDHDIVAIGEFPDNVSMAALSMAISSTGAFKNFNMTVLLTMEEAVEAMSKAGTVGYRPPSG
jgi:uncharacterized protein with GYD domain